VILETKAPYDFRLSAGIMNGFDGEELCLPLRINGRAVLVRIRDAGAPEAPRIQADAEAGETLSDDDLKNAYETVSRMLNLRMDLKDFYEGVEDSTLQRVIRRLRGLKVIHTQSVFEALVCAITEQQVSLALAMRMEQRISERFGEPMDFRGKRYHVFPEPERLNSIEALRACGLSTRKAEYIVDIAAAVRDGRIDPDRFRSYERTEDIIEELCRLRGVGLWTAKMTVIRSMPRYDAFPADDVGIRRCIARYYFGGRRISTQEAEGVANAWGAYKGLASYYLVRATMLGL